VNRLRRLGWSVVAAVTVAAALAAYLVSFPEPVGAIAIDRAVFQGDDGHSRDIALPPGTADRKVIRQSRSGRYLVHFELASVPDQPLLLLVPATSQGFLLELNGDAIFTSDLRAVWSEPMVRSSSLVRLPRGLLRAGRNELMFAFNHARALVPAELTRVYLGPETALAANFRWRTLFEDDLKVMTLAVQALLGIGILIVCLHRPRDPLYAWLGALITLGLLVPLGLLASGPLGLGPIQPYVMALAPAVGLMFVGFALALIGARPPGWLAAAAVVVPAALCLLSVSGALPVRTVVLIDICLLMSGFAVVTAIVAWGAIGLGNTDARLLLGPVVLLGWFSGRDFGVVLGLFEGAVLLTSYARALALAAVLAVLMRRLAVSLDRLDTANEDLKSSLAEQQAELAALHREERREAARLVREHERRRLTRDLHDGISGHLVSIIAMAERSDTAVKPIEQAAREALDDLRLVIYSLDLGDRELPLALANFRERLIPQLRRIGVELDWSTAALPEVAGVTPGNALSILRIMQEAITNALKHGPARTITVRGAAATNGASIVIENDGRPARAGHTGLGIENMRHRAGQLGGTLQLDTMPNGMRVTLLLPLHLPDLQEAAAR
jgi:signal transduction histidine kinase